MARDVTNVATVGYVSDLIPVELIEAAGLRPLRVGGQGITDTPLVDRVWDSRRRADADAIADGILEQALGGAFADFALLAIPHTTKAIEGIATAIEAARREGVEGLPPIHLLDRSYLTGLMSSEYNTRQFRAFAERLGSIGAELSDDAVEAACRAYRDLQQVKDELAALRRVPGGHLAGAVAVESLLDTWTMPATEAASRLRDSIAAAAPAPAAGSGIRIFLAGSATDTPDWHRAIEERGGVVIAEDDDWGPIAIAEPADDPLRALARRFCEPTPSAVSYPMSTRIEATLARVQRAEPDLVLAVVRSGDELGIWETPQLLRLLAGRGIPAVHLPGQPYVPDAAALAALDRALTGVVS